MIGPSFFVSGSCSCNSVVSMGPQKAEVSEMDTIYIWLWDEIRDILFFFSRDIWSPLFNAHYSKAHVPAMRWRGRTIKKQKDMKWIECIFGCGSFIKDSGEHKGFPVPLLCTLSSLHNPDKVTCQQPCLWTKRNFWKAPDWELKPPTKKHSHLFSTAASLHRRKSKLAKF